MNLNDNFVKKTCPLSKDSICSILNTPCVSVMITPCINLQSAYHKGFTDCHAIIINSRNINNNEPSKDKTDGYYDLTKNI